ncbi:GLPGLI family protein [Zhouia sp. PK063]|uniref:GLPGLI family protein n=1 Tax=Zhouia sp. PK063 TaxID=3373602 RepID=UPI003799EA39
MNFSGRTYLIDVSIDKQGWDISKESKVISGYTCYKATKKISLNGKNFIPIEAWFTPSLPFSVGPTRYGKLPGLILYLNQEGIVFYAKTIVINPKEIAFKVPKSGKEITQENFNRMIDSAVNNLKTKN